MGFKIAGMEMLAVVQNFQLILQSNQDQNFQIDFSSHGYIDAQDFILKIMSATHLLTYFNFMFLTIVAVFLIGMLVHWISLCKSKSQHKVANSNQLE